VKQWRMLHLIPAEVTGSKNELSSPLTAFKTRGRNITVCPASIYCFHSILSLLLKCCLSTMLYKYTDNCSQHSRRNKLFLDNYELTKIMFSSWVVREVAG
jgi:hypothetical protein